jgi:maltose O-acetyltransferase
MNPEQINMIAGRDYNPADPGLVQSRQLAHQICHEFNWARGQGAAGDRLWQQFKAVGQNCQIEPPFYCDYGANITLGDAVFINFNAVILDEAPVDLGTAVKLGPNIQLLTVGHPLDPQRRRAGWEFARPIAIGENTWLGGGVMVLPGVTIGRDCVIGAGSVVTRDIPDGVVAVGNPCRVLRAI